MRQMKFWLTAIFFHITFGGMGQSLDLQRVIVPSPNVASLFKFNDEPISLYTGTTNVQIPIYTLEFVKLQVPISLMYHSGGINVTEDASWVGLGWALNAGGAITSVVNGYSDANIPSEITRDSLSECDLTNILNGLDDSQKDLYYYNFGNLSGEFYFNDSNQVFTVPYTKVRIQNSGFQSWIITDVDGTEYYFAPIETTVSVSQPVARGIGDQDQSGNILVSPSNTMGSKPNVGSETWFLSKIVAPTGDSVLFNYVSYYTLDEYFRGETNYYVPPGQAMECTGATLPYPQSTANYELERINSWRLQSIVFRNGSIQFITGGNRCDLIGDSYLSEIAVTDNKGDTTKEFKFQYDYFVSDSLANVSSVNCSAEGPPTVSYVDFTRPALQRRLMLTEVDQMNVNVGSVDNKYLLSYNTSLGLPMKFSSQQDTWGFYNGNGQGSLLQNLSWYPFPNNSTLIIPTINGRTPSLNYAEQGALSKITYPTGGSSTFVYESNTIPNPDTSQGTDCGATLPIPTVTINVPATSNDSLIYTLTVNNCQGGDSILFQISNCHFTSFEGPATLPYGFNVENGSDSILFSSNTVIANSNGQPNTGATFYLPNGTYFIYSFSSSGPDCSYTLTIPGYNEPQYIPPSQFPDLIVEGGLRIKQIIHTDPIGNTSLIQNYNYNDSSTGLSSGVLPYSVMNFYSNWYFTAEDVQCGAGGDGGQLITELLVPILNFNSNTNYPLTGTHGAVVGYSQVTETRVDGSGNDIGKTVNVYSTPLDESWQGANVEGAINNNNSALQHNGDFFPFAPSYSNEWQRGVLLQKDDYKNIGGGNYAIAKRTTNYYSQPIGMDVTHSQAVGYELNSQMPYMDTCVPNTSGTEYNVYSVFKYTSYRLYSQYQLLDSTTNELFDNSLNKVKVTTHYTYDPNNLLPDTTITTDSKGETVLTKLTYPPDYSLSGTSANPIPQGIQNLQSNYIISPVIEKYIQKSNPDGSNKRTISAILTTFNPTVPEPAVVYDWEPTVGTTNFSPTTVTTSSATLDPGYLPKIYFDAYGSYATLLQQHKFGDGPDSYIWDYDTLYPIAEVKSAAVSDIAYTSFEADGKGNWTIPDTTRNRLVSMTGSISYNLNSGNTITRTGLNPSTTYIVGYWSTSGPMSVNGAPDTAGTVVTTKSGTTWTYYEHKVTSASTISVAGTGTIDELRLFPQGSLMTTYTYTPLIGMTGMCTSTNYITYYNYDGLGRLANIKDLRGNIVKTYNYHYQSQ